MANPARIREALIKMLSDKKSNTRAQEEFQAQQRGGFEDRADADLADMTKGRLQDSRREASRVQPVDPLAPNPQNPLGRNEAQVVRSGGGAPLTVRGPSGQLPGGADNPRLGAENRFSSSFDDDFGPMSRDLDTFPDDALSDPAAIPGRSPHFDATTSRLGKLTPEEKAELNQMDRDIVNEGTMRDGIHAETTGQTIDSGAEGASIAVDQAFAEGGMDGVRRLYKAELGRDFSVADNPINSNRLLDNLDEEIPF